LAAKILGEFKQRIKSLELEPSAGGAFELTADGKSVYSKLETGAFPDEAAVMADLNALID
jgi:selenoprotein W-related protein